MDGRKTSIRGKMSTCTTLKMTKAKIQKAMHNHSKKPLTELTQRQKRKERAVLSISGGGMDD
jgi:hypothetical protein